MSRIAKYPVVLPKGVEVSLGAGEISVKGPLGTLSQPLAVALVTVERNGDQLQVTAANDSQQARAMSGTVRALLANMVTGVSKGFERKLTLVGVGYRAQAAGDALNLTVGFSHPVSHKMPKGVKVETPTQTEIIVKGIDKQQVGQVAAEIRAYRKPEPYKGKGIRYADEHVVIKETKKK
jgi:large subunit ribosomal protein L6